MFTPADTIFIPTSRLKENIPDIAAITREFDTFPNEKQRISRMNAYIFLSNLLFLYIGFFRLFVL